MNESEEGGKLRSLAKEFAKGKISEDDYKSRRAEIILAFRDYVVDRYAASKQDVVEESASSGWLITIMIAAFAALAFMFFVL